MTFGFGLLVVGLAALMAGIKGVSIAEVLKGAIGPDNPIFNRGQVAGGADEEGAPASGASSIDTSGGARGIVEAAAAIAAPFGTTVVSDSRPGAVTTSGNASDHSENNATRAARDIGVKGVDAFKGPPPKQLDEAIVAIGKSFGKNYKGGKPIVDTFNWHGFRVQVIWRVPSFGGHMGHIHIGAHQVGGAIPLLRKAPAHRTRRTR
jgi:hypothetical protein